MDINLAMMKQVDWWKWLSTLAKTQFILDGFIEAAIASAIDVTS